MRRYNRGGASFYLVVVAIIGDDVVMTMVSVLETVFNDDT